MVAKVEIGEEAPNEIAVVVKSVKSSSADVSDPLSTLNSSQKKDPEQIRAALEARAEKLRAREEEEQADWKTAEWKPYTPTVPIDLGSGDGQRVIWIAGRWDGGKWQRASGTHVEVLRAPPLIVITSPTECVTSQPMIQLKGYSVRPLQSIRFDVINASNRVQNEQGFVNNQVIDFTVAGNFSTNFFTCYDIDLSVGTNIVILRCEDLAGNVATNTLTYLLDLDHDKTPPVFSLDRPVNGHKLCGDTFTARGQLDDFTAKMAAVVAANGQTNTIEGLVERNGCFWVEGIPLGPGTNYLSLTATDAAGNSSSTNVFVIKSDDILIVNIDAIPPDQLWQPTVTVTGKVSPSDQDVWVNGVQASVRPDGTWTAKQVPVLSPNGGTAVFNATAIPRAARPQVSPDSQTPAAGSAPRSLAAVQTVLDTNATTLNASQPACATFTLHLTGAAGRSFVLLASTNLATWTPILTNVNSAPTFDYTDTNAAGYSCRFFRVVPLP